MDPVLFWNDVALAADRSTHTTGDAAEARAQGPAGSSRALAMVHLAIHDAYFGINTRKYPCYLGNRLPSPPPDADFHAAIASAAHAVLSALYPAQKAFLDARHAAAGLDAEKSVDTGHAFGQKVAAELLALRRNDPGFSDNGYSSSPAPRHHRQDPDNPGQGFYAPFYGSESHCFAVTARHHLDAPPQPGSPMYMQALREVRSKGIAPHLAGTLPADLLPTRTPSETSIGLFWAYDGAKGLGTPPGLFNQIVRAVAVAQENDIAKNARLFAMVNTAMGDAGILAWSDKYTYDLWRPVLGIRENDSALGPMGVGSGILNGDSDPNWLPLGSPKTNDPGKKNFTPPFPAYPSGHATFGAAAFQAVRKFYGQGNYGPDNLADGLEFVSGELDGITVDNTGAVRTRLVRQFTDGLWQMIQENGTSRVFLGVHWVFDAFAVDESGQIDLSQNIGGVRLGLDIANDLAANGLKASAAAGPDPA